MSQGKDLIETMCIRQGMGDSTLEAKVVYNNPGDDKRPQFVGSIERDVDESLHVGRMHSADAEDFIDGKGIYRKR